MKIETYMKFMYKEENVYRCLECPANRGKADGRLKPCGERHCIVSSHLREVRKLGL